MMDDNWRQRLAAAIAARRERLELGGTSMRARQVTSAGIKAEAVQRFAGRVVDPGEGVHLWTVLGVWRIAAPHAERYELDVENLLTLQGPGCYKCEQQFSDELAASACPGSV